MTQIQVRQPDFSGLNYVAGKSGGINIAPTGALGLQAYQEQQNARNAIMRNNLEQQQLQQQGQLALNQQNMQEQQLQQQAQNQQRMGLLQQQQQQQQGNQFNAEMALKQQQSTQQAQQAQMQQNMQQRQLDLQNYKDHMAEIQKLSDKQIQDRGGFASYALMSMQNAKSPDDAQQYWSAISKEAVSKNYLSQDQADQLGQLPLSQRVNALKGMVISLGATKEFKDMQDKATSTDKSGISVTENPDGTRSISIRPTSSETGKIQESLMGADRNISELTQMIKNIPDDFFGTDALGQNVTYLRELGQNIPGLGKLIEPTKSAKDSNQLYNQLGSQTKNMAMEIIKDLSGLSYTDKQLEFMNEIIPQIGPTATRSQFEGRANNMLRFFEQTRAAKQDLLEHGFQLNSPQFKDALLDKMKQAATTVDPQSGLREHLLSLKNPDGSPKYSKDQVENVLKHRN